MPVRTLCKILNPRNPLVELSETIDWNGIEEELTPLYAGSGRRTKPIRLMVGLNLLENMFNLDDKAVIKAWLENPYYQFFTGEIRFQWRPPAVPADLAYFRKCIMRHPPSKMNLSTAMALKD